MARMSGRSASAGALRAEISARNLRRAEGLAAARLAHETTFGRVAHVIYAASEAGEHGNFLPGVYRRIVAHPEWARRLEKTYTASARVPRASDRRRGELECATSSDALLMNVFCSPGVLRRTALCVLLGIEPRLQPEFGVRALLPMRGGEVDRTELDMRLGGLLVEAKLTEGGFGTASRDRLLRYPGVAEVFEVEELPWGARGVARYQVIRGVLAALACGIPGARFALLCDGRRADLVELWFRVLRAVRSAEVRSRMQLCTWQEIARTLPPSLRKFLAEKYGIVSIADR